MAYMIKLTDILSEVIDYEFYDYINSKNSLFEVCNLLEFPVRVDTINMSIFDDIKSNHDYVLRVKKFGKLVGHYEKYDIYQFTPINDSSALNDVFVYKDMAYIFFNYELVNGFVQEKKIWQDRFSLGLFREIMFNYYLDKFKGIISDVAHSPRGEKYWKTILTKAKSEGFKVYVLKNDSEKIPLDDINHIDKYFTSAIYKFVIEKS
jgi:hypothetical protein